MIRVSGKRRDSDTEQEEQVGQIPQQPEPSLQQEEVEEGFDDEYYMSKRRALGGVAKRHQHAQLPTSGGLDDEDSDNPGMMPVMIEPNYSDELEAQNNRDVRCRNCLYVWALGVLVGLIVVIVSNKNAQVGEAALGSPNKKANKKK